MSSFTSYSMKPFLIILISLVITLTVIPSLATAQIDSSLCHSTVLFKESNYYELITRRRADTTIRYYSVDIDDSIQMYEEVTLLNDDALVQKFIPYKFFKRRDSLFIKYYEPIEKKEIIRYQYPLNYRDTLNGQSCYKIFIDSTDTKINDTAYAVKRWINECSGEDNYITTFKGDTVINLLNHTFKCYKIEQNGNDFGLGISKNIILIEKNCLIPIEEVEYVYRTHTMPQIGGPPKRKWILARTFKLIDIKW